MRTLLQARGGGGGATDAAAGAVDTVTGTTPPPSSTEDSPPPPAPDTSSDPPPSPSSSSSPPPPSPSSPTDPPPSPSSPPPSPPLAPPPSPAASTPPPPEVLPPPPSVASPPPPPDALPPPPPSPVSALPPPADAAPPPPDNAAAPPPDRAAAPPPSSTQAPPPPQSSAKPPSSKASPPPAAAEPTASPVVDATPPPKQSAMDYAPPPSARTSSSATAHSPPASAVTPPATDRSVAAPAPPSTGGMSSGATAGVAVVAVIAFVCFVGVFVCLTKRRKRKYSDQYYPGFAAPAYTSQHMSGEAPFLRVPSAPGSGNFSQPGMSAMMSGQSYGHQQQPPQYYHQQQQQQQQFASANYSSTMGSQGPARSVATSGDLSVGNSKSFSFDELYEITGGFSRDKLLGEGGFGCVFKGTLGDGREVAVKQLKGGGGQGEREFQAEVEIISRVHHRHLVSLVGYCISEDHRLLVYDFVANDTMHHNLHGREGKAGDGLADEGEDRGGIGARIGLPARGLSSKDHPQGHQVVQHPSRRQLRSSGRRFWARQARGERRDARLDACDGNIWVLGAGVRFDGEADGEVGRVLLRRGAPGAHHRPEARRLVPPPRRREPRGVVEAAAEPGGRRARVRGAGGPSPRRGLRRRRDVPRDRGGGGVHPALGREEAQDGAGREDPGQPDAERRGPEQRRAAREEPDVQRRQHGGHQAVPADGVRQPRLQLLRVHPVQGQHERQEGSVASHATRKDPSELASDDFCFCSSVDSFVHDFLQ